MMEDSLMFDLNRTSVFTYPSVMFTHEFLVRKLTETSYFECRSDTKIDVLLAELIQNHRVFSYIPPKGTGTHQVYFINMKSIILLVSHSGSFSFEISGASNDRPALDALMSKISDTLPPLEARAGNIIPINFWSISINGARNRPRYGTVPVWNESLALNYTGETREQLSSLMALRPPIVAGRLLLWHGVPGTGKSYMIRTLAQNWRSWCSVHYIVDPERFLGDANYMLSVIFDNEDEKATGEPSTESGQSEPTKKSASKPWRLIIMEDANEFMGLDAKERMGQSMSRLLNMADGLIGQELNLLILITTNEPIDKIHPAIKRFGRCLSNIEFGLLSADESEAWLKEHKAEMDGSLADLTVAELYAQSREQRQVATKINTRRLGFVRG